MSAINELLIAIGELEANGEALKSDRDSYKLRAERAEKWIRENGVHPYRCPATWGAPCTCEMDAILKGMQ